MEDAVPRKAGVCGYSYEAFFLPGDQISFLNLMLLSACPCEQRGRDAESQ